MDRFTAKPLLLISACAALAAAAYLALPASTPATSAAPTTTNAYQAQQLVDLNQSLIRLQEENQQLRQALEQLRAQVAAGPATQQPAPITSSPTPPSEQNTGAVIAALTKAQSAEQQRRKNEGYATWLKDSMHKGVNPAAAMQANFEQEAVDDQWAPQQEQKIANLFITTDELRDTAFKAAKCHSTQCEISLAVGSAEQSFGQVEKISKALQNLSANNFVSFATNLETSTTTLYLSTAEAHQ